MTFVLRRAALALGLCFATSGAWAVSHTAHKPSAKAAAKPAAPATTPRESFADNPAVVSFANEMQQKHGLDAAFLLKRFGAIHPNAVVLKAILPPATPTQRSWERYRPRFLGEQRINGGVQFWQANRETLKRAAAQYGVPEEIIVAIIGVETEYGRNKGSFSVMEALASLAFYYPPRAEFFRQELEQFLLLARENGMDPLSVKGSYAGAIGIPQFMPGSQRRYAVDFDGDQKVDLRNSVEDAIGSVGRFLEQHGWRAGEPVTVQAAVNGVPDPAFLEAGLRPRLKREDLAAQGIVADTGFNGPVALVDLVSPGSETEYWLGFDNFYVITRYNRSSFYAMSVYQLAEAIKARTAR